MTVRFRNDFGESRVVPTAGYVLVPAGGTVTGPDDEWHHWDAGGWTALDPDPRPKSEPEPAPEPAVPAAPTMPSPAVVAVLAKTAPTTAVESEDQL